MRAMVFNRLWKRFMAALLLVAFAPIAYFGLRDFYEASDSLAQDAVRAIFLNAMIRSKEIERSFINAHSDIKILRYGSAVTSLMEAARDRPENVVFWKEQVEREFVSFLRNKEGYSAIGALDEYGDEVVTVMRAGRRIVPMQEFQKRNHATSAHFLEAARQEGAGVAAITMQTMVPRDVDLRGVTLTRYATKVFDSKGAATGVLYLDLNGSEVLSGLSRTPLENRRVAAMVTHQGKYIFNPFTTSQPAYSTLSAMEQESVKSVYSAAAARQILSGRAGIITDDPDYLIAYSAIYPEADDHGRFFVVYDRYSRALLAPAMGQIYRKYALGAVGSLALAAIAAIALSRALTKNLAILRQGVKQFAEDKSGAGKIHIRSGDEIEALAQAFNSMAESLTEYGQALEKKVEERSEKIKEVERKLMQAEKLAAIGFLSAGVAHEINNPISVVVTRLELIRRAVDRGQMDKVKKDLDVLSHHAQRIGKIAGNLLTFSRQKPGEMAPVDLNEITRRVVELIEYSLEKKGIRLELSLAADLPLVWANASGMEQVVYNIVYNAYQVSEAGSVISISTAESGEAMVDLKISDTGPGIPHEAITRIFEPFFTTKEAGQGSGLGLSISYGLVKDFGGGIEAHSGPGPGATFTVSLRQAKNGVNQGVGMKQVADA